MRPILQMTNEEKEKIDFWKRGFPTDTKFDYHFHERGTWDEDGQAEFCFSVEAQGMHDIGSCHIISDFVTFEG